MSRLQYLRPPLLIPTVPLQRRPQNPHPTHRPQLEAHISPHPRRSTTTTTTTTTSSSHHHIVLIDAVPDDKGKPGDDEVLCSGDHGGGGFGLGGAVGGEGDGVDGGGEFVVEVDEAGELDEVAVEVVAAGGGGEVGWVGR